ncbi:hypothetical protein CK203_115665 [Vitis vinifera]|uniref:Uncharacterized protein n=1 Tax=Vitis vinifera TaxID=29760 RepID=A0A438C8A0_VITVI|nr:hypothetical protein CK203_115665 [Vitis vinifera]
MTEPPQPPVMPLSEDGAPPSPPQQRYQTRRPPTTPGASSSRPKKSVSRPPTKKARVSGPIEPSEPPQPHRLLQKTFRHQEAQRFIPPTAEVPFGAPDDSKGFLLSPRARHIAEALRIPYEPVSPTDYKEWAHLSQSNMADTAAFGYSMPPEHDMPGPSEPTDPSQDAPPAEQTVPHEDYYRRDRDTDPEHSDFHSRAISPHNPPTTT